MTYRNRYRGEGLYEKIIGTRYFSKLLRRADRPQKCYKIRGGTHHPNLEWES